MTPACKITTLSLLIILLGSPFLQGQTASESAPPQDWNLHVSTDLVSRYIWRGQDLDPDGAPHIQPLLLLEHKNFEAGLWGSYNLPGTYQEIDLYAKISSEKGFYFQVYDIFIPIENFDFFNLKQETTQHLIEPGVGFAGTDEIPFSFFFGSCVYGYDEVKENGDIYYSSYFEANYFTGIGETDCALTLGLTPFQGYYADQFSVVNLGLSAAKEIQVNDRYSIPVKTSFVVNPDSKKAWFTLAITL